MKSYGRINPGFSLPQGRKVSDVPSDISATMAESSGQLFLRSLKLAHWIILFYPLFLFSISRRRELEELYTIDTSAMVQIIANVLFGIYAFTLLLRMTPTFKKYLFKKPLIWFFSYILLAGISFIWSDRPAYTLYRSTEVLIFLILIAYSMISLNTVENMIKFQLLFGFILVISWHFLNLRYGFSFDTMHNPLISGSVIGMAFLGWIVKGKLWRLFYISILLSIFLATSSATYLSLIFGFGIVLIFRKGKIRFFAIFLIILVLSFMMLYGLNYLDLIFWGKSEGNIQTASGRLPIWQWVLEEVVPKKPVLGYSFGEGEAISRVFDVSYKGFRVIHMHNVAISALVNLGITGFLFFLLFIFSVFKSILNLKQFQWRAFFLAATFAIILNALSFSSITAPLSFGWLGHALFFSMVAVIFINKTKMSAPDRTTKARIVW
jgi:hypothetical protein